MTMSLFWDSVQVFNFMHFGISCIPESSRTLAIKMPYICMCFSSEPDQLSRWFPAAPDEQWSFLCPGSRRQHLLSSSQKPAPACRLQGLSNIAETWWCSECHLLFIDMNVKCITEQLRQNKEFRKKVNWQTTKQGDLGSKKDYTYCGV